MRMQSDGLFPANTHSDSARHWASAARMSLHEDGIVDWGPQVVRLVLVGLGLVDTTEGSCISHGNQVRRLALSVNHSALVVRH